MLGSALKVAVAAPGRSVATAAAAAKSAGARLLVLNRLPEAAAEPSDGAGAHAMGELAEAHRIAILFAYAEACSGRTHLALQLTQADGRATANYRATHLGPAAQAMGWAPGNWLTLARLEPVTLGLLGGLDHLAPEVGRALSSLGAETLIAVTDASLEADFPAAAGLYGACARLRAIENGVPVCLVGPDGTTHAAAADGTALAVEAADGLALVTLGGGQPVAPVPRRPDLYHRLVEGVAG